MKAKSIIVLTGAMGSGKSAASSAFSSLGANVIDTDALAKFALDSDEALKREVVSLLGSGAYSAAGELDRRYVASKVFADKALLEAYEALVHPATELLWKSRILKDRVNVLEIPLFFEKRKNFASADIFDFVCSIYCGEEVRRKRLLARGMGEAEILRRDSNQMTAEEKLKLADVVFFNDGSEDFLKSQIEIFFKRLIYGRGI